MPEVTSRILAEYDYLFSAFYLRRKPSLRVLGALIAPSDMLKRRWHRVFDELTWDAPPGEGGGFLVSATRST